MVEETTVNSEVAEEIRQSDYYTDIAEVLKSQYKNVEEQNMYAYKTNKDDSEYVVTVQFSGMDNKMSVVFQMSEDDEILDAEASVSILGETGEPERVDEYIHEEDSIRYQMYKDDS